MQIYLNTTEKGLLINLNRQVAENLSKLMVSQLFQINGVFTETETSKNKETGTTFIKKNEKVTRKINQVTNLIRDLPDQAQQL